VRPGPPVNFPEPHIDHAEAWRIVTTGLTGTNLENDSPYEQYSHSDTCNESEYMQTLTQFSFMNSKPISDTQINDESTGQPQVPIKRVCSHTNATGSHISTRIVVSFHVITIHFF
jgi:hypothetical protein